MVPDKPLSGAGTESEDRESEHVDADLGWREGEAGMNRQSTDVTTPPCVRQLVGRCCMAHGAQQALRDDLSGGGVAARWEGDPGGVTVYLHLSHFTVQWQLTQHCTVIMHQLTQMLIRCRKSQ